MSHPPIVIFIFYLATPILAYFIGSIPFGLILAKISGYGDIRNIGSGNIGATNVLRTGNKKLALLTLIFDGAKGAIAIFIFTGIPQYTKDYGQFTFVHYPVDIEFFYALLLGFFAILGHCFPVWLKFKGGKGVATALGVLLAAVPYAGLAACATWLLIAFLFKYSSLAALIAVALAPVVTLFIYGSYSAFICLLIALLVWWRHKENIKRLLNGTEPKIGSGRNKTAEEGPAA